MVFSSAQWVAIGAAAPSLQATIHRWLKWLSDEAFWSPTLTSTPRVLALVVLGLLAVIFPICTVLCCALCIVGALCRPRAAGTWSAVLLAIFLAWVNATKAVTGDLVWYLEHYRMLATLPFENYLGHRIGPFTIKTWEPVYYTFSFVLSRLTDGAELALPITITLLLYIPTGIALTRLCEHHRLDTQQTITTVMVCLHVIITFTLSTQLVRQEVAACFLFCTAVVYHLGAWRKAALLGLLGCLSHTSAVVPAFAMVCAAFCLHQPTPVRRAAAATAAVASVCLLGLYYAHVAANDSELLTRGNDGAIHPVIYGLDFLLWIGVVAIAVWRKNNYGAGFLACAVAVHGCFLLFLSDQPIPLLRMYFYVDLFRGGAVLCIVLSLIKSGLARPFYYALMLVAWTYSELRIIKSPFLYGGGLIQHLMFPLFLT